MTVSCVVAKVVKATFEAAVELGKLSVIAGTHKSRDLRKLQRIAAGENFTYELGAEEVTLPVKLYVHLAKYQSDYVEVIFI